MAAAAALEKLLGHHRLTPQDLLPAPKPPAGSRGGRAAQDRPGVGTWAGGDIFGEDGRPPVMQWTRALQIMCVEF